MSRAGERLHAAVITQVMAAYARYAVIFVAGVVSCVLVANVLLGGIIVPLNSADFALLHGTIFSPRTSIWTSVQKLEILSPDQHGICSRPTCKNSSHFDAILIAGGGQTPEGPPPHVILRLEKALPTVSMLEFSSRIMLDGTPRCNNHSAFMLASWTSYPRESFGLVLCQVPRPVVMINGGGSWAK